MATVFSQTQDGARGQAEKRKCCGTAYSGGESSAIFSGVSISYSSSSVDQRKLPWDGRTHTHSNNNN